MQTVGSSVTPTHRNTHWCYTKQQIQSVCMLCTAILKHRQSHSLSGCWQILYACWIICSGKHTTARYHKARRCQQDLHHSQPISIQKQLRENEQHRNVHSSSWIPNCVHTKHAAGADEWKVLHRLLQTSLLQYVMVKFGHWSLPHKF